MNKKLITSFVSAALVCSMGMSGVSAVTPVPTMHNNNQVTATSLSRSVADYKKIEGINASDCIRRRFYSLPAGFGMG